jgi:hypothetical protein
MRHDHGLKKNVTMSLRLSQIRRLRQARKVTGKSMSRMMREAIDAYLSGKDIKGPEAPNISRVLDDLSGIESALRALHNIRKG